MAEQAQADQKGSQKEIERSVLSFDRSLIHEGVHLARIGLRKGEASSFHHHTVTRDTFFVMGGALTITLHIDEARAAAWRNDARAAAYESLSATAPRIERLGDGREVHRARLLPGEVFVIEPNVVHCASNIDDEPCHFLCIEGIGSYDFISSKS